jgi:hypothetical protein
MQLACMCVWQTVISLFCIYPNVRLEFFLIRLKNGRVLYNHTQIYAVLNGCFLSNFGGMLSYVETSSGK